MSEEPPDWKDMPEPHPVCSISWEDIYSQAVDLGWKPLKHDITEMMGYLDSTRFDCNSDYNSWLENHVREYFEENGCSECKRTTCICDELGY